MEEPQNTAIAFFNFSHSYAISALALQEAKVDATHSDAPVSFLCFHAIELYLKSFLIAQGFTERQLRTKKYGHDICSLANEAEAQGLILTKADKQVFLHLSDTDNIMTSRYIRLGYHQRLHFDALYETCYRLHTRIGKRAYQGSGVTRRPVLPPGLLNKLQEIEADL